MTPSPSSPSSPAAADPRWPEDPSPSFDEIAAAVGVETSLTSPDELPMDLDLRLQLFWPAVFE
jgi:hypothetical protein